MSIKALQDYTYYSKCARYNKSEKRRETWAEAVDRVKNMHLKKFPQVQEEIEWAFEQSKQKRVLGSQRALQFGGTPIERKNARLYNCTSSYCDRPRFFQECFWLLLCGCGTGFSVQKHHVAKIPDFHNSRIEGNSKGTKIYQIPDTIEGWADALGVLISTYLPNSEFSEWYGYDVEFDYSLIRPAGSYLSSGVGKAPGAEPLKRSLNIIQEMLDKRIKSGFKRLRTIDAYDIVMHASDAVLAGGVRRSATICIFSLDDDDMMKAKTGNWMDENPQRGRSNNSVLLLRSKVTKEQFAEIMHSVKEWGEPGFFWSDSTEQLPNPCVVGDTVVTTTTGLHTAKNLVGKSFESLIDGNSFKSGEKGFWQTGYQQTILVKMQSGRSIAVTPNHLIMTTSGWKEAGLLTTEDNVVVHNHRNFNQENHKESDYAKGYLLGHFLSDGNVSKETAEMKWWGLDRHVYRADAIKLIEQAGFETYNRKDQSESSSEKVSLTSVKLYQFANSLGCLTGEKHISTDAICGNWGYLSGFVAGYFDADGTVAFNPEKGSSIRITSSQLGNLEKLQIILNAFGIYSTIYNDRYPAGLRLMPDGNGGEKEYNCKATHELCITCDNIEKFSKEIYIRNESKRRQIEKIVENRKRLPNRTLFTDKVVSVVSAGKNLVYDVSVPMVEAFDANGIYVHNCVEVGMYPVWIKTMESGWQMCNLCEINGRKIKTKEDFVIAAKAGAIIGTVQAGYTDFAYLGSVTENIIRKEALLGISITGMMDNPDVIFNPEIQREMAQLIVKTNTEIAAKIGINPAARCTCVKPAGTTSCILGSSSGVHPHHAKRYLRRVQANSMEAPFIHFKNINPRACETSVWSANKTDEVISFCVEVPSQAKTKNDVSALELLKLVQLTQQNWVSYGKVAERCTAPWLSHNVSNTINVLPEEWDSVRDYIFNNQQWFAGVSLLPQSGDLDYPQAPFVNISTGKEIVQKYGEGSLLASGLIVDGLHVYGDLWAGCKDALDISRKMKSGDLDKPYLNRPNKPGDNATLVVWLDFEKQVKNIESKEDWIRRVIQFANRYCDGDVRKCTYMLKDVNNWKLWLDLNREYKDVDYTSMYEETDETKAMETIACAGGACSISLG